MVVGLVGICVLRLLVGYCCYKGFVGFAELVLVVYELFDVFD